MCSQVFTNPTATTGMMRHFADGHRRVPLGAKPSGKAPALDGLAPLKKRAVAGRPIRAREQRKPRRPTSGRLHIMPLKRTSLGGQLVDVRRVNVIHAETLQLRPRIIDANQQRSRPLFRTYQNRPKRRQKKNKFPHEVR